MEVLADKQFRKAVAAVGGMDEMVMEFIRIPDQGHPRSLANRYKSDELGSMTLSPQVGIKHLTSLRLDPRLCMVSETMETAHLPNTFDK